MNVAVLNNQRLVDLCMQKYGDPSLLFVVAQSLGLSITDELDGVIELEMPVIETNAASKSVAQVLQQLMNKPASGDDNDGQVDTYPPRGIGYMKIRNPEKPQTNDFIVS